MRDSRHLRRHERGFALMVTLGFALVLGLSAAAISASARFNAALTRNSAALLAGRELLRSAEAVIAIDLRRGAGQQAIPRNGAPVAIDLPGGRVIARIIDERAKFDANQREPRALHAFFAQEGARQGVTTLPSLNLIERERLRQPFVSLPDLALRLGLPPELHTAVARTLTVYNPDKAVNLAHADETVLALIPGMTPGLLAEIRRARRLGSPMPAASAIAEYTTNEEGPFFTLELEAQPERGATARLSMVVTAAGEEMRIVEAVR